MFFFVSSFFLFLFISQVSSFFCPQNMGLLGAERRERARWLAAARGVSFPDSWRHFSEHLRSLKHTHSCYVFLEEVAGVSLKHTGEALFVVTRKEIMVSALPGRPPRQAPRYPTVLLAAMEDLIKDPEARLYWKVLAWWLLV